jgi:hypothetical protein
LPLQYDRDDLYRKVWERPLIKVAQEYGVSAVALGKACSKLLVPVPGRGHWAKLAHGHTGVRKMPLPKLDKVPVVFRSSRVRQNEAAAPAQTDPEFAAIDQLLSFGALKPPPVDASGGWHVLVRRTASRLRSRRRKSERGILLPNKPGGLDVRVTAERLERALLIMSQLLAVLERQGFTVEVTEKGGTVASMNGQRVVFGIEEVVRQIVTRKPRVPEPKNRWDYDRFVSYEPRASLALVIHSETWRSPSLRKRWADAKIQRLEDLIPDFVAGVMRTAVALRLREQELKERELERQKRAQEMIKLREQIEAEEKKMEQFNQWIESWEKAERLRRFIAAYAQKTSKWAAEKQSHYKEWIAWANQQADRVDPFVSEKPVSVLDRKPELRGW